MYALSGFHLNQTALNILKAPINTYVTILVNKWRNTTTYDTSSNLFSL